jgi:hypothetical protein
MEHVKLGHQAPKGYRINNCNSIHIEGELHYCESHNFMYNSEEEEKKLYRGEPCYYTDTRFVDSWNNFYNSVYLFNNRRNPISIKSAIRRTRECKGIPKGTIVDFGKSWYYRGKKIDNSFNFKIKKENPIDIDFEINDPSYKENFTNCEFSQKLTDALRENGFIVRVTKNTDFLTGMINTASAYTGGEYADPTTDGEIALAYGHGKKIGFSSFKNDYMGYSYGVDNILWDAFGYFCKWSRCNEIPKTTSVDDIVKELLKPNSNTYPEYDEEI